MLIGKTLTTHNMATKTPTSMKDLLEGTEIESLKVGDAVEGRVIDIERNGVWLDLGQRGTGLVVGKELEQSEPIKLGDVLGASVLDPEADGGFAVLSLKRVAKEKGWEALEGRFNAGEVFNIEAYDANKGGLLVEVEGIRGFLPVSQLAAEHYPRVAGADKDEILHRLNSLVNKPLRVRILDLNRRENKLIVSEKEALREDTAQRVSKLKVGDVVEGLVTGVVDFGIFLNIDGIEGLVHISEIAWDRVDNPSSYVKVGEKIKAKIIAIDKDKLSLSIKQLSDDPWLGEIKKYKVGDLVEGKVTRITPFGAFVQVTPVIEALVHVSELADESVEDASSLVKLGEARQFKVIDIDTEAHKLSLSLKQVSDKKPAKKPAAKAKKLKSLEAKSDKEDADIA